MGGTALRHDHRLWGHLHAVLVDSNALRAQKPVCFMAMHVDVLPRPYHHVFRDVTGAFYWLGK